MRYFRKGSFKFGTLVEYRSGEFFRFSDAFEGLHSQNVDFSSDGYVASARLGKAVEFIDCFAPKATVSFKSEINEHVFCATHGAYSREHHLEMVRRNPDLTHFIEMNIFDFTDAVEKEIAKHENYEPDARGVNVFWQVVKYESRDSYDKYALNREEFSFDYSPTLTMNRILKTVFNKPQEFSYEKEIRIVARLDGDHVPSVDAQPLHLKSYLLLKSIKQFGHL